MEKCFPNEEIILEWLQSFGREVIDFREFRLAQRIDVDFGIETVDGTIILAEIKADHWVSEHKNLNEHLSGNLCFELCRINHFVENHWFYLGWGWRSPAQKLISRNPNTGETFVFEFLKLRKKIGQYVNEIGKNLNINIVETDDQKTTFNLLIPMCELKFLYKKFNLK